MPGDLPGDFHHRRQPLTGDTGRGIGEQLREAIAARLAPREHAANTLDGGPPEA